MSCKQLNPNFKTSEASTKSWMRTNGFIDRFLNIIDLNGFREANKKWSDYATSEYGTEGMLFAEEGTKALPNKEAFEQIDKAKGITNLQKTSTESTISLEEFERQRLAIASITGLEVKFDPKQKESGKVSGKTITVNPDKLFSDTLVHEIAHIFIDSMGGLSNPLVARGLQQLKGTAIEKEVTKNYPELDAETLQKEILATAIGREGADIFRRVDRLTKWQNWLKLFYDKVKQLFGFAPNIAREMARQIIHFNNPDNMTGAEGTYAQKDIRISELEEIMRKVNISIRNEIALFKKSERPNYKEAVKSLQELVSQLEDIELEKGIREYVDISKQRLQSLKKRVQSPDLTFDDLKNIKDYLSPYSSVEELQNRVEALAGIISEDQLDRLDKDITSVLGDINYVRKAYFIKAKDMLAKKLSTASNGTVHIRYREQYEAEFDKANLKVGILTDKRFINGKRVDRGEYEANKKAYVAQKMQQYNDKIVAEEEQYMRDIFDSTPSDIGIFEHFAFEGSLINDEIIQVVNEMITAAENQVKDAYLEIEGKAYELFQEYKKENPSSNQNKQWDKFLADELDADGNPTGKGKKSPYLAFGKYNPMFVKHKRDLTQRVKEAKDKYDSIKLDSLENQEANQEAHDQALEELRAANKAKSEWLKANTVRISKGVYNPTDKWLLPEVQLSDVEQRMKNFIIEQINAIDSRYPASGKLKSNDYHVGEMYTLPKINKGFVERVTGGNIFGSLKEWTKKIYTPDAEDVEYGDRDQAYEALTRDGKFHYHIPIYYRQENKDQSFDVLTAIMMDAHMSLNYQYKKGIEAEILALQDIDQQRDVAVTTSSVRTGIQTIKRLFGGKEDVVSKDEISRGTKVLKGLINARMYGIRRRGDKTLNKIVDSMVTAASTIIMPANVFSTITNLMMGKTTTAIEILGNNMLTKMELGQAEAEYARHIPGIFADLGAPKKSHYINKIMEKYDSMGDFFGPTLRFSEDSRFKQVFNRGTLYALTRAVEHYIHGVVTIASLKSIKLQNQNGDYIDTEGNVVDSKTKAATMYDTMSLVDKEIKLADIPNAYKTDLFDAPLGDQALHDAVKMYIRDIVAQTQGQYDSKEFSLSELNMFARMFFGLRQWIPRGFEKTFRGFEYALAEEIPEQAEMVSRAQGRSRIGYNTVLVNTTINSGRGMVRYLKSLMSDGEKLQFDIVKQPWENLTPVQRSSMRKAIIHYGAAISMYGFYRILPTLVGDDEDDLDTSTIYALFALRRVQQELMFYANPAEVLTILRSPAASISMLENIIELNGQLLSDVLNGEFERYDRTRRKGQLKVKKKLYDLLPVFSQLDRDPEEALGFLNNLSAR